MNSYKVETLNAATHGWDAVATIRPDYAAATLRAGWIIKRRLIVIANADEAEAAAEVRAIGVAKRLRHVKTRIERTAELDGHKIKTIIWQEGRWLVPAGWRKRLAAWRS